MGIGGSRGERGRGGPFPKGPPLPLSPLAAGGTPELLFAQSINSGVGYNARDLVQPQGNAWT